MHTHVIRVNLVRDNDKEDVDKVKKLFKEALRNTKVGQDQLEEIESFLRDKLPDVINKMFMLSCGMSVGKGGERSYSVLVYVMHPDGRKSHIVMSGGFWSLDSLKNIVTLKVAEQLKVNTDVEKLDIPDNLKPNINMICKQLNKENS